MFLTCSNLIRSLHSDNILCKYSSLLSSNALPLSFVDRIDVVSDVYNDASLKAFTRSRHSSSRRIKVELSTEVPQNWQHFLRSSEKKRNCFHFLAQLLIQQEIPQTKYVIVTHIYLTTHHLVMLHGHTAIMQRQI